MSGARTEPGGDARVVLVTAPDEASARRIARTLVSEGLVACVNVIGISASIYEWDGKVEEAPETLLIMKTGAGRIDALAGRLVELHPYDVPELLSLPVDRGLGPYLRWIAERTGA